MSSVFKIARMNIAGDDTSGDLNFSVIFYRCSNNHLHLKEPRLVTKRGICNECKTIIDLDL